MIKFFIVILFLMSPGILASDELTFSSFGTIGLTMSDSERYGYRSTIGYDEGVLDGDVDFLSRSLLGIQVDWTLSPDIDFVSQFVLRDMPEPKFEDYLSIGFLRYTPSPHWTFRVGRTVADLYLITEFRNIGFSYNWATVSQEVYGMLPYRHVDGLDVDYTTRFLGGTLSTKVFTGISEAKIPTALSIENLKIKDIIGISSTFDKGDWVIQARSSQVTAANEGEANKLLIANISKTPALLWPNALPFSKKLKFKGSKLKFISLGIQSYIDNFSFSTEVSRVNSNTPLIPQITSGYGSLSYQKKQHTYFAVGAFVNADNYVFEDDVINKTNSPELVNVIEQVGNFYAFNQKSISVGWRWDISYIIASTVQLSRTYIDDNGGTLWINNSTNTPEETVNSIFINVSWVL